jgi:hypothetical protein
MLLKSLLFVGSALLFGQYVHAATPCEILTAGNVHYAAGNHEKAIVALQAVEAVDKLGKDVCTSSVYATIATSYALMAKKLPATDVAGQLLLYRNAARYNRLFGNAAMCSKGDCKAAEGEGDFWR